MADKSRLSRLFRKKEVKPDANQDLEKQSTTDPNTNDAVPVTSDNGEDPKPKDDIPPASFFTLFRYVDRHESIILPKLKLNSFSTPFEVILNILGIFAAVAAGAAQPLMTLIFGNLAKTFVSFGSTTTDIDPNSISPAVIQAAEQQFKSLIARYCLVLLGMGQLLSRERNH